MPITPGSMSARRVLFVLPETADVGVVGVVVERLDPADVALVRENAAMLRPRADRIGKYFYAHLFHAEPALRAMFPDTMRVQTDRFVESLLQLAEGLEDPDSLAVYLRRLGFGHRRYRVRPEHYPVVGASLLAALEHLSGPAWNPRLAQAWLGVYTAAADIMAPAEHR
ncbi:globin domain-containing protein [Speluncibacter jeojiensis]|uniref:Globin domain-containing protein n=1 Tax=Speluncibacter jeojiensis TaxID=2710754 RepID=A0A9X4RE76_9ACTN|nr:globin domain-containing protein [Corynebacteriales bacterium D3-21]